MKTIKTKYYIPYICAFLFSIMAWLFIRDQIQLYQNKPTSTDWKKINGFIYHKALPYDGIAFEPAWLAGYATDRNKFNYLSIPGTKKIIENKTEVPERLWFISTRNNSKILNKLLEKFSLLDYIKISSTQIYLLERNDETRVFDFTKELLSGSAFIKKDGQIEFAYKQNSAFIFKSNPKDWNDVKISKSFFLFNQEKRTAIQFHPVSGGEKVLKFKNIPRGDYIKVLAWLADTGKRYDNPPSVYFSIKVNGAKKVTAKIDETNPEQYLEIPIDKTSSTIEFTVEPSSKDIKKRHIFFSGHISKRKTLNSIDK